MQDIELSSKEIMATISTVIRLIADQHEFEFNLGGAICRFAYQEGEAVFKGRAEDELKFQKLFNEVRRFEERISSLELDPVEVSIFLHQYFHLATKITTELRRVKISLPQDALPIEDI
jgi:hypothetical protein